MRAVTLAVVFAVFGQQPAFKSGIELVTIPITVTNATRDQLITAGLEITDFRVFEDDVRTAEVAYEDKLDSSFFRVRLDRTTELERSYLRAMAELGPEPQSAADVASQLRRTSQQCGPTRSQLIEKGLLYTPSHGYAAFTVPHFDRFMKRAVPVLSVPEVRVRGPRRA